LRLSASSSQRMHSPRDDDISPDKTILALKLLLNHWPPQLSIVT